MKRFYLMVGLVAVAMLCADSLQAQTADSTGGGVQTSLQTSDVADDMNPVYRDWRIEMLRRQPAIEDIPSEVLGAPAKGLRFTLSAVKSRVRLGEKIFVHLVVTSITDKPVSIPFKWPNTECGLTTLIDGPEGRVPYRWLSDPQSSFCHKRFEDVLDSVRLNPIDWDNTSRPISPGTIRTIDFNLLDEFNIDRPGPYEIVVKYPLVHRQPDGSFNSMEETFGVSNKVTITVY